ncbi:MAG: alpha/beta hydrolase [Microthrixaceae bacterium]
MSRPRLHPVGAATASLISLLARRGDEIVLDGRRLDPQVRALLTLAERVAPTDAREVDRSRADIRRSVVFGPPVPRSVHAWERTIPGPAGDLRVRFYRDADTKPGVPAICFFHGGGWVVGDLDSHDPPCRALAQQTGAVVMAVDYRLAPEARFPAAVEDCLAAYVWLSDHAGELGVDATRLAVMGDSAGGNLAALVALAARDGAAPAPALQVLVYPGCDLTMSLPSIDTFAEGFMLTRESMLWFRSHYLPDESMRRDPAASPLFADPTGVAPALVFTAGFDPLRDEGRAYAARLAEAGVPTVDRCFDDLIHGFYNIGITRATLMAAQEVNRTVAGALQGELDAP